MKILSNHNKKILQMALVLIPVIVTPSSFAKEVENPEPNFVVKITGIDKALESNAEASLTLLQQKGLSVSPDNIDGHIQQGEKEIQAALQPFGYYEPSIKSSYAYKNNEYIIRYSVQKGEPIRITSISVSLTGEGRQNKKLASLVQHFPLKKSQRLLQPAYSHFKDKLLETALSEGFLDSEYTIQEIQLNLETHQAEISLHLDTGNQYRYGKISFLQNTYDESFLERFLNINTDQIYNIERIRTLQHALSESGFFSQVDVSPVINQRKDYSVPIDIALEPHKRMRFEWGLGYGTDTGIRSQISYELRRITKNAHSLKSFNRVSEYNEQYLLQYTIPAEDPSTDYYQITTAYIDDKTRERNLDALTRKISASKLVGDKLSRRKTQYKISFEHESYRDLDRETRSTLLLPSITWEWLRAHDRFNTKHGFYAEVDVRGASETLLSSTSFAQLILNGKIIRSPFTDWRIIGRSQLGLSLDKELEAIPPSLRFFAGGDNSVRGYAYQSLAPKKFTSSGRLVTEGAPYLIEGSLEIERKLFGDFRGAVFYDVGNAVKKLNDRLKQGAGFGIRWESPIGLLRVDLAFALSSKGHPLRLHVNIGPDL